MGLAEHPPRPWVRSLALGVLALVVLANGYSDTFGDHWGNVWRTVNPLFIGSSTVAAVALWRTGNAAGRVAGVVSLALGAIVFANAYFVDNGTLWDALNPLRMLTAVAWAAVAGGAHVAAAGGRRGGWRRLALRRHGVKAKSPAIPAMPIPI